MAALPYNIPRSRDATFVNTDLYPHDTEMRIQLATVDHRSILNAQRTVFVGPSQMSYTMAQAATSNPLQVVDTGYVEIATANSATVAVTVPGIVGENIVSWRAYLRENGGNAITATLRKRLYGAISGQGTITDVGTDQTTPGTTAGDTTLSETLGTAENLDANYQYYLNLLFPADIGGRVYGVRFILDPDHGLST